MTVQQALKLAGSPERAKTSAWFFKTGKGEYGFGDKFYGITVPEQRKIAKQFYKSMSLEETFKLLQGKYHEERFTALEILVMKFDLAKKEKNLAEQNRIYTHYLKNTKFVNNWDLVDTSAEYIVGAFLSTKPLAQRMKVLKGLANSKSLWEKRIAMISCFYYIRHSEFKEALVIAEILLKDPHDLIHKAVGWMIREIGNRDLNTELKFLDKHTLRMSRTTLRYAIEKFPEKLRLKYLKMK